MYIVPGSVLSIAYDVKICIKIQRNIPLYHIRQGNSKHSYLATYHYTTFVREIANTLTSIAPTPNLTVKWEDPQYILNLIGRVITLSLQTVHLVNSLPPLPPLAPSTHRPVRLRGLHICRGDPCGLLPDYVANVPQTQGGVIGLHSCYNKTWVSSSP